MTRNRSKVLWCIVFSLLFALSLDYWRWHKVTLSFLNIPLWIFYFALLQLIFAVAVGVFSVHHWGKHDAEEDYGD